MYNVKSWFSLFYFKENDCKFLAQGTKNACVVVGFHDSCDHVCWKGKGRAEERVVGLQWHPHCMLLVVVKLIEYGKITVKETKCHFIYLDS
ncbi:hypothetical protein L1987_04198 [Smallanthus sonchifolius]|uniref:Uncharacterized protein n=1 Tax=Smallanthus sonchifolius TaxID=185202 RepID=A0ACB9KCY4_9ASTR|nr:hypothetical protein L1987_04198 [Smallanthus sonchifolius]